MSSLCVKPKLHDLQQNLPKYASKTESINITQRSHTEKPIIYKVQVKDYHYVVPKDIEKKDDNSIRDTVNTDANNSDCEEDII